VPAAFATIVREAFAPSSMAGGAAGSFLMTLMWGIRRGLFSNEAGQGSAPIAHATAKTDEPVREGLVALLEPFIDTLVICTMTGLVIIMTGTWLDKAPSRIDLAQVEVVPGLAADDELVTARARRASAGEQSLQVQDGRPVGAAFVYLNAIVEDARILVAAGTPYSGVLRVDSAGAPIVEAGTELASDAVVTGNALLTGAPMTARAFQEGLPGKHGDLIVTVSVLLFAVSTAISWSYYGDRATEYLFGARAVPIYRWLYVAFFFLGCILPLSTVWTFGDVALGLMSLPNLICLILLSGQVRVMTRDYFSRPQVRNR
jgi:AGCS family alanine or glycine:cation symporter